MVSGLLVTKQVSINLHTVTQLVACRLMIIDQSLTFDWVKFVLKNLKSVSRISVYVMVHGPKRHGKRLH